MWRCWCWLALSALVAGCPDPRDGATPDAADPPLCGNGWIDLHPTGVEDCDDGEHNGTSESYCTKQCNLGQPTPPAPTMEVDLGVPIASVEPLDDFGRSFAVRSHDDHGVLLFELSNQPGVQPAPPIVALRVAGPVTSLGKARADNGRLLPLWAEVPPGEPPRLFFAEHAAGAVPIVHEIPYPFPDGTAPTLTRFSVNHFAAILVDQSRDAPHDLLVATISVRSAGNVETYVRRFPAPGAARRLVVDTGWYWDRVEQQGDRRQLVVFFDDPGSFVAIDVRRGAPNAAQHLEVFERARGNWPYPVIAADVHYKSCVHPVPELSHPIPIAVLTDDGRVMVWQFDRGLDGESLIAPFARVAPESRTLTNLLGSGSALHVLEPDGQLVTLSDGDCQTLSSTTLMPTRRPYAQPWSFSTLPANHNGGGYAATADSVLYR